MPRELVTDTVGLVTAPPIGASQDALLHEAVTAMTTMFRILRRTKHKVTEGMPPEIARLGEGQYRALHALCEDGRMTAGELAEQCTVADPTISKVVKSLEAGGFVSRETDPDNRRVVWVILTPQGRALHDHMVAHMKQQLAEVIRPLAPDQLRDLILAFGHLERLLEHDAAAEISNSIVEEN
jgi:DNA-binding MarR family transcriptional regulator